MGPKVCLLASIVQSLSKENGVMTSLADSAQVAEKSGHNDR